MNTKQIAEKYYLDKDFLDRIILQNEIPYSISYGKICITQDQVEFVLELYAQKEEENETTVAAVSSPANNFTPYTVRPSNYQREQTPCYQTAPAASEKLISGWGYLGYDILFSIPIVGFILLIVFSLDDTYLNRRNFARSYWCRLVVFLLVMLFLILLSIWKKVDYFEIIFDAMQG